MNNNQLIALALQNDFDAELAMYDGMPEHRFSLRFRRRMRKLLGGGVPEWETKHVPLRKAVNLAIIMVILLAFLTGATLLIYKMWDKFQLHDVGEHSFLVALDIEGAPTTLEDKYRLGIDLGILRISCLTMNMNIWLSITKSMEIACLALVKR